MQSPLFWPSPTVLKFFKLLILFVFLSFPVRADDLLATDLSAYKSSKYASPKWNGQVEEGLSQFHKGQFEEAYKNLFKAFNLGCESPIILFQIGLINEYNQTYYSALEFYKMAGKNFKIANGNHRYAITWTENYGRALYMHGKRDEALPILSKASKNTKSFWLLKL